METGLREGLEEAGSVLAVHVYVFCMHLDDNNGIEKGQLVYDSGWRLALRRRWGLDMRWF